MGTFLVTVEDARVTFPCKEDEFVMGAMLHAGKGPVRYGCCGGGCGICKMRVVSGDYEVVKPMSRAHISEAQEADGLVLTCCVKPRGDLTLGRWP
ncbi:MAG: 2Fe-2S iron-sulfur cluster binding domain-containing protein [Lachnospiraceae bacterium]|jgi:ferredoxin|nr:2Fe-2S iron-sulfur cluster binding domain-containing protein [Lachnospiraceae bacterium]